MEAKKLSSFSRTVVNESKAGAYFTDLWHMEKIRNFLEFPENEFTVLEPSMGDGKAVCTLVETAANPKIFGIEINADTWKEHLRNNPKFEAVLCDDFLEGAMISPKAFSLCFANPPYMSSDYDGERMELLFHKRIYPHLMEEGVLVWVIPLSVMLQERYLKSFVARYEIVHMYKFHEKEFAKYKQCVVIAKKRESITQPDAEYLEQFFRQHSDPEELPEEWEGEKLEVKPKRADGIRTFQSKGFHAELAYLELQEHTPIDALASEKLGIAPYEMTKIYKPPIELKNDSLYIAAVSGAGAGLNGSVETEDVHLQRGIAKVVTSTIPCEDKDGKRTLIETQSTKCSITIIETSGKITRLE